MAKASRCSRYAAPETDCKVPASPEDDACRILLKPHHLSSHSQSNMKVCNDYFLSHQFLTIPRLIICTICLLNVLPTVFVSPLPDGRYSSDFHLKKSPTLEGGGGGADVDFVENYVWYP